MNARIFKVLCLGAIAGSFLAGCSSVEAHETYYNSNSHTHSTTYDSGPAIPAGSVIVANVVDARPAFRTSRTMMGTQEVCTTTQHRVGQDNRGLGALVGGLIGNEIGNGKSAGTVVGVIIGHEIGKQHGQRVESRTTCSPRATYSNVQELSHYNVTYELNGRYYQSKMYQDPGATVDVRVLYGNRYQVVGGF
jgi:uncharacterized protein YcfJ